MICRICGGLASFFSPSCEIRGWHSAAKYGMLYLVENAKASMTELGIEPVVRPIRGGTDGARLSFMGLPCPNLSTGGENFHSRFEFVSVEAMEKISDILVKIATV